MKKLFILLVGTLMSLQVFSQNIIAPTKSNSTNIDSITTYTYQIENTKYPIYKSKKGAYYIWKTSKKTNKKYKYYLPKDIQIKIGRIYEN